LTSVSYAFLGIVTRDHVLSSFHDLSHGLLNITPPETSRSILLDIPIELCYLIIEFVVGKALSSLRIPCCRSHAPYDDSWGWYRDAQERSIIPAGVRDVLSLAQVNYQLQITLSLSDNRYHLYTRA
jgi:hypothetical protein